MAGPDSSLVKLKASLDFGSHYENLCALNNIYSQPSVKAFLHHNMLDISVDRLRITDWMPILETLKINKNLEHIAIRSTYDQIQDISAKSMSSLNRKPPAIRSKEITFRLCKSIRDCLLINRQLQHLCFDGIFIRSRDMDLISKGLYGQNTNLRTLSFEKCSIGDELLELLCPSIKNIMSLVTLNLSSCQLTCKSAETLAHLIKHQYTARHNEAWHDSLRYNKPDLDRMGGLRRITINNNVMIGDEGCKILADCLRDDLWIKALDMHNCGISKNGGQYVLEMLKFNSTLVVLDVRDNYLIDPETISSIMNQLIINIRGQETEFKWLKVSGAIEKATPRKRRSIRTSFASNKRTLLHRNLLNSSGRKRSKTKEGIVHSNVFGLPWRTALRAEIHRSCTPERATPVYESLSDASNSVTPLKTKMSKICDNGSSKIIINENETLNIKELAYKLEEEMGLRLAAEDKINKLLCENARLSREVTELRERTEMLENEDILENIEQSFQQFHQFLDTLKTMGLENLVKMVGIDSIPINIKNNKISKQIAKSENNSATIENASRINKNVTQFQSTYRNNGRSNAEVVDNLGLDIAKNDESIFSLYNEMELDNTPIAEQLYDSSHQEDSSLKYDEVENASLLVKSIDESGTYRNAVAVEAENRNRKNRSYLASYLRESNRGSNNKSIYLLADTMNAGRQKPHDASKSYELNTNKLSGTTSSADDYKSRYLEKIEKGGGENWEQPFKEILLCFDNTEGARRPRSKFDELYERIKNKAIIK